MLTLHQESSSPGMGMRLLKISVDSRLSRRLEHFKSRSVLQLNFVFFFTDCLLLQVETLKECGGGECIPDLKISVIDTQIKYVLICSTGR